MKLNIAFDIDGCLLDVMPRMKEELDLRAIAIISKPHEYWTQTDPGLDGMEWINIWAHVFADYKKTPPYFGAVEFMTKLHGKSQAPINFITSRNIKHAIDTHRALRYYLKVPFTISFANRPFSKLDYLNGFKWMVEDNPQEILEMRRHNINVIMPQRPWNQPIWEQAHENNIPCMEIFELHGYIDHFVEK